MLTVSKTTVRAAAFACLVLAMVGLVSSARADAILITRFPTPTTQSFPFGITTGPDGNLWFTESAVGKIGRITPSGVITEFALPEPNSGPLWIAAGPDGNLWFTEVVDRIGRITPAGQIVEFPVPTSYAGVRSITGGPDGNVWFTEDSASKIGRITPGGLITEFALPGSFPSGITAGPDGTLWFAVVDGIGRMTPDGVFTRFPFPVPPLSIIADRVTPGPDGALWFVAFVIPAFLEPTFNAIGRVTTDGVFSGFPVRVIPSALNDLTTGPDGNLWFTELHHIARITPTGALTPFPTRFGIDPTGNFRQSDPTGITVGPDGNLWFAERSSSAIGKITASRLLEVSPPSGVYLTTQRLDAVAILAPGLVVTGGEIDPLGLTACVIPGTLLNGFISGTLLTGGRTFRCPGAPNVFGPGTFKFGVYLDLADGSSVSSGVTWEVLANTEP